ncbi:uncharacterized protein LOC143067427 isoform X2 [Mytilus galloprovincialis]|uniref:uncharacterized protein LOC143067427 isoform X2 n=1 Tax=Mytilus galloprovincialis TaxID=29158 RepID=UPI003F7BB719
MPNRSFWIEAKESLEQNAKTMPMSSRILGIGVIFVAFIVLSIGLIVGLKFPGFVEDRIKEDQCVVSEEYSHYNQWLKKCGPYIYKKTARKVNVVFRDGYVSFKYLISFNFDEDKTQEECGINCKSSDEIIMLDTDKIEEIGTFKSSEDYLLGNIPEWINLKIEELSVRQTNISENVFSLLGLLNNTANTEMDHLVQNISFGRWIGKNDTEQKIVINNIRNNTDFSENEMTRLYNILSSAQEMGLPLTQETTEICRNFAHINTCSQHLISVNSSFPGLLYPYIEDNNLKYSNFRNICGLLLFIQSINESNINCFLSATELLSELFCFANDTDCISFMLDNVYISNLLLTLKHFVFHSLYAKVINWSEVEHRNKLFKISSIKELVIGYDSSFGYVYGELTKNMTREVSQSFGLSVRLSTCILDRHSGNNMMLYNYQGSDISTASQYSIYNTYFIQPLEDLKTCTSQTPAVNSFLHFSEEFACAVYFKQNRIIEFSGINLFKYISDVRCPLNSDVPCCNFIESFIDIEPLSGKIWRKTLCRQKKISFSKYGTVTDNVYRLNISTYSFSTFLRESRIEISSYDVGRFKTRIEQMLDASCVGMISLTVIASGVFILAVCILCWPQAKRKVHPFILEQSHNLAHSRL